MSRPRDVLGLAEYERGQWTRAFATLEAAAMRERDNERDAAQNGGHQP